MGICTVSLVYFTSLGIQKEIPLSYYLTIFTGTLVLYNLYAKLGQNKLYLTKNSVTGDIIIATSAIIGIYQLTVLPYHVLLLLVPGVILSAFYVASETISALKYPKFLHPIVIALVFSYITALVPILAIDHTILWSWIVYNFLYIFVLCLLFDIGDVEADSQRGLSSIPALIGIKNTKILIYIICSLLCLIGMYYSPEMKIDIAYSIIISPILVSFFTYLSAPRLEKHFYLVWIDGLMLVPMGIYLMIRLISHSNTF